MTGTLYVLRCCEKCKQIYTVKILWPHYCSMKHSLNFHCSQMAAKERNSFSLIFRFRNWLVYARRFFFLLALSLSISHLFGFYYHRESQTIHFVYTFQYQHFFSESTQTQYTHTHTFTLSGENNTSCLAQNIKKRI